MNKGIDLDITAKLIDIEERLLALVQVQRHIIHDFQELLKQNLDTIDKNQDEKIAKLDRIEKMIEKSGKVSEVDIDLKPKTPIGVQEPPKIDRFNMYCMKCANTWNSPIEECVCKTCGIEGGEVKVSENDLLPK